MGRQDEGIALLESTVKRMDAKLGRDHRVTLLCRVFLASAYEGVGRWSEAEALERDVLARRRKLLGPENVAVASSLSELGRNLINRGRFTEAEPLLREAFAFYEKSQLRSWMCFHTMSLLGGALLAQARYAEAESLVISGYEGMKALQSRIAAIDWFVLSEAAERVIALYEKWNKPAQAATWKTRLGLGDLPADVFARP